MFNRLENVPSVQKKEEGRHRYSRERGKREMLAAAVGGSSERVWHKRDFFTCFFCAVWEIITSQILEHSMKFAKHKVHHDIEDRDFYSG